MQEYIQLYRKFPLKPLKYKQYPSLSHPLQYYFTCLSTTQRRDSLMFFPEACEGYLEVLQGGNEMFQDKR